MRYAYHDLGDQEKGTDVVVRWQAAAADVLLLDPVNFSKYCEGRQPLFFSAGGRYGRSPARLTIPQSGRWYVVADLHGYSVHAKATVEVLKPDSSEEQQAGEKRLVEVA
jgi:uncharacterized protein DUF1883